jgi:hypothetical protein
MILVECRTVIVVKKFLLTCSEKPIIGPKPEPDQSIRSLHFGKTPSSRVPYSMLLVVIKVICHPSNTPAVRSLLLIPYFRNYHAYCVFGGRSLYLHPQGALHRCNTRYIKFPLIFIS